MVICGPNPVMEALRADYPILKVYVAEGFKDKKGLLPALREKDVKIVRASRKKLSEIAGTEKHKGIVAVVSPVKPVDYGDLLEKTISENGYLVFLDRIEDPRNLGAIFRTADAFGAGGIVIPKDRCSTITEVVVRTSAGAVFHVPFSVVGSFSDALRKFKDAGGWLVGLETGGRNISKMNFPFPLGIVAGSEGKGISRTSRKYLDCIVSIPMKGSVSSLNVSNAVAIGLYLVSQQTESSGRENGRTQR